jgi:hypothetical protein
MKHVKTSYRRTTRPPRSIAPSPSGRGQAEGGPRTTGLSTQTRVPSVAPSLPLSVSNGPSPSGRGQGEGVLTTARSSTPPDASARSSLLPRYDIDLRELFVAGEVIAQLPVQARNLAAALTALELAGWKPRVPQPLAGRPGGSDANHLAVAAYKLNARQSLIHFHADDGALRWNWRVRAR